jgi:butyryl-CoA dehydrogenase
MIARMRATAALAQGHGNADIAAIHPHLAGAVDAYERAVDYLVRTVKSDVRAAFAGSVPYLRLAGIVHGGWQLARAALAAQRRLDGGDADAAFLGAKVATARFFADHVLSLAPGHAAAVLGGGAGALALPAEQF